MPRIFSINTRQKIWTVKYFFMRRFHLSVINRETSWCKLSFQKFHAILLLSCYKEWNKNIICVKCILLLFNFSGKCKFLFRNLTTSLEEVNFYTFSNQFFKHFFESLQHFNISMDSFFLRCNKKRIVRNYSRRIRRL